MGKKSKEFDKYCILVDGELKYDFNQEDTDQLLKMFITFIRRRKRRKLFSIFTSNRSGAGFSKASQIKKGEGIVEYNRLTEILWVKGKDYYIFDEASMHEILKYAFEGKDSDGTIFIG